MEPIEVKPSPSRSKEDWSVETTRVASVFVVAISEPVDLMVMVPNTLEGEVLVVNEQSYPPSSTTAPPSMTKSSVKICPASCSVKLGRLNVVLA